MNRRQLGLSAATVILVGGAGVGSISSGFLTPRTAPADSVAPMTEPAPTVPVRRGDLAAEHDYRASVSFGEARPLTTNATGTLTQVRERGTVIEFGETLMHLDNRPVFYGYGAMPMYRELYRVRDGDRDENGKRLEQLRGFDVAHLQSFLIEAGFDLDGALEMDGVFGAATEKAVKAWQKAVGLSATGRVDNAQLVLGPDPIRIASELRVGATFDGIDVNDVDPTITVETSNRDRGPLRPGTVVEVALPDGGQLTGTVTDQEQATKDDGSAIWRTSVRPDGEVPGDAASATVTVTEVVATGVLIVPVSALLALAEGGFAVEVVAQGTSRLVAVEVGEVLEGRAEVTGALDEGDEVVVPE